MSTKCPICGECFFRSYGSVHCDYCYLSDDSIKALSYGTTSSPGNSPTLNAPIKPKFDLTKATDCELLKEFKSRFEGSTLYACKIAQLLDVIGEKTIKKWLKEKKNAKRD